MTDPLAALIGAFEAWDHNPGSRAVATAKEHALHALGIDGTTGHTRIAEWRRKGFDVPSACQAATNDLLGEAWPDSSRLDQVRPGVARQDTDQTAATPHLNEGGAATTTRKAS